MSLQSEIIKKKKKKKDRNKELNSQPPIATADVPIGEPGKKKKKKRKAANAEGGITEVKATLHQPADAQGSVPDQPEKRKKKKKKSEQPSGQPELAAVGDRELARSGKPIVKDLYTVHAAVAALTPAEVDAWRGERETVVTGRDMKPVIAFDQAGFSADLLQSTRTFAQPSPIQAQCWPIIQSGNDLVGIAATGSGKTLAFGLPGLKHILAQKAAGVSTGKHPTALVLAPTRELAQQIAVVLDEAGQAAGLRTLCVYGGVPKLPQTAALRKGVDVVVATPGRLEDLINDGACRLSGITYLVLDEADRMLDLGFEPHIRAIAGATRADRQTLMFSATWPPAIQKLASEFQASPTRVTIGSQDLSASHSVRQIVEVIDPAARDRRLEELLRKYHASRKNRVLVFVLYKKEAARVEAQLSKRGWNVRAIHGDINQRQRSEAVEHFKSGTCPLLIATDVAARGLDIPDVEAVINYSFPLTTEDYVHRIGRTGRAGKSGLSHTFFSGASDKARAGELINVLREANQEVPEELLKFGTTVKRKEHKLFGAHFKDVDFTKKATKVSFDSDDE
ncbi:g153 [Coccomyxa elongata]